MIPGMGRSPEEGKGYPLQYSCLENSMGRGAGGLQSLGLQKESDTTEGLTRTFTLLQGELILPNYVHNSAVSK